MAAQWVKDFARNAKSTVKRYPEIKAKTKEATSSNPWGPTDAEKKFLAAAVYEDENRTIVYKALGKRLGETDGYHNHVWKAMDLFEYFLLMDTPEIKVTLRQNGSQLSSLLGYSIAKDKDDNKDKLEAFNLRVRHKAQRILDLLGDSELLAEEQEKAFRIAARTDGHDANVGLMGSAMASNAPPPGALAGARSPVMATPTALSVGGSRRNSLSIESRVSPVPAAVTAPTALSRQESPQVETQRQERLPQAEVPRASAPVFAPAPANGGAAPSSMGLFDAPFGQNTPQPQLSVPQQPPKTQQAPPGFDPFAEVPAVSAPTTTAANVDFFATSGSGRANSNSQSPLPIGGSNQQNTTWGNPNTTAASPQQQNPQLLSTGAASSNSRSVTPLDEVMKSQLDIFSGKATQKKTSEPPIGGMMHGGR